MCPVIMRITNNLKYEKKQIFQDRNKSIKNPEILFSPPKNIILHFGEMGITCLNDLQFVAKQNLCRFSIDIQCSQILYNYRVLLK